MALYQKSWIWRCKKLVHGLKLFFYVFPLSSHSVNESNLWVLTVLSWVYVTVCLLWIMLLRFDLFAKYKWKITRRQLYSQMLCNILYRSLRTWEEFLWNVKKLYYKWIIFSCLLGFHIMLLLIEVFKAYWKLGQNISFCQHL